MDEYELEVRIAELETRVERLEEALREIVQWADDYPIMIPREMVDLARAALSPLPS